MKDVPHHMMKFMRKVIKKNIASEEEEEEAGEELLKEQAVPPSKKQNRKKKKEAIKQTREARIPSDLTPEEKNKEFKKRTPIIRERSHNTRRQ
jgi:hypothetical protein